MKYKRPCRCGHVMVESDEPISEEPVLPCCTVEVCPQCGNVDHAEMHTEQK